MWRSFFLAIGVYLILLGAQCLGVQKFVLKSRSNSPQSQATLLSRNDSQVQPRREIEPPPWAPWSIMSTGAVVCLYSFHIPRRLNGG